MRSSHMADHTIPLEDTVPFLKRQLESLLSVVVLEKDGEAVEVDGFRMRDEREPARGRPAGVREGQAESTWQDIRNASLYEPRIELIKRQLESLLGLVEVQRNGDVVEVDGFRLRNLKHWLSPSACDPSEVFGYAGARCNCDCIFCCNKGNAATLALGNLKRPPAEELSEMMTRLDYFYPKPSRCLFPSLGDIYEVMMHPHVMEVLRSLRDRTPRVFRITTNGDCLTPETIAQLAQMKPVYLYVSLNSASAERRRALMRSRHPEVAIESLHLLKDAGIPYAAVAVAWPFGSRREMLEDLSGTVAYADACGAHLVQVNLPGYSRYFSEEKLFDLDEVWSEVVSCVRGLRSETCCPVVVMPSMYEENLYEKTKNVAKVIGVVKNSPAARSGLMKGDVIRKVGGVVVQSKPQARDLLSFLQRSDIREVTLVVGREGGSVEVPVNLEDFTYPYTRETDHHLGAVFVGTGLRLSYLESLRGLIDSRNAQHVLFLSSALVKPTFEQVLSESHLFGGVDVDIEVPRNTFFGGNVFMGDLLVVQDFVDCIKGYLERGAGRPDLVVIPSSPFSLGGWRRDLTGRVYLDIEREVGIPVELLECSPIFD